ncbi:MAG: pyridoxal phosphate-dependent aminotransferase [Deltaproteobacteria bacterium]|nr:pyridoxal phosphate-dependent aminotransferase [Deltaproteobacteria bacterium]
MLKLSNRAQNLKPSATLAMAAKAKELKAKGVRVIDFTVGEPDFDTPTHIKDAAKAALDAGFTKYTQTGGIPELKDAIRQKLKRDQGTDFSAEEIIVTFGVKHAIANALLTLINEGDEVIIPAPYWVSYPEQVKLAGGVPHIITTTLEENFLLSAEKLKKAISPNTKALILNSPSNPTGSAYSAEHLKKLLRIAADHDLAILSDEIYEKIMYDGQPFASAMTVLPEIREQLITFNGVSKAYAMTGWRVGYAVGPKHIIAKMQALQDQQTSSTVSFVQKACVTALTSERSESAVKTMVVEFEKRRNRMFELIQDIPAVTCRRPPGAFFLFPFVGAYFGKKSLTGIIDNATALAEYLLAHAHVATVSGDPFGAPGYIRLSYATSMDNIEEGIKNIKHALQELK